MGFSLAAVSRLLIVAALAVELGLQGAWASIAAAWGLSSCGILSLVALKHVGASQIRD